LAFLVSWKDNQHLALLSDIHPRSTHLCVQKGFIHWGSAGKHCLYESLWKRRAFG